MDVRNSREKFDEIKEEFAINPAPIASQSSLNAGGDHEELEIFLKIGLIHFTNRSKVKEKRGIQRFLKNKFRAQCGPSVL